MFMIYFDLLNSLNSTPGEFRNLNLTLKRRELYLWATRAYHCIQDLNLQPYDISRHLYQLSLMQ